VVITASRQQETWNKQYTQRESHKGTRICFGLLVSCPAVLARCAEACDKISTTGQLRQEEWH